MVSLTSPPLGFQSEVSGIFSLILLLDLLSQCLVKFYFFKKCCFAAGNAGWRLFLIWIANLEQVIVRGQGKTWKM